MDSARNRVFETVWETVVRRTFDRAAATAEVVEAALTALGPLHRDRDSLLAGDTDLARERNILPQFARATGLGICLYLGNRRVANATVLDAGTAPELEGFAPSSVVDACLRRRDSFHGRVDYTGRTYLVVARPLFAAEGRDLAPLGILEVFQDEDAYFDLFSAASRRGVDDEQAAREQQADSMAGITQFIDDVARRLQLLALNGNIIAAQAGEHGRAFRVVCRELGALADQAKATGGEVRELVQEMGLAPEEQEESASAEAAG